MRAGRDAAPERDDHPALREAWAAIHSPEGQWRMRYGLALTDPRWLDADEETIARDLLQCLYWDAAVRRSDPKQRLAEEMAEHAEAFDEADAKIREAMGPDGAIGRLIAFVKPEAPKITEIRMGGRVVAREP